MSSFLTRISSIVRSWGAFGQTFLGAVAILLLLQSWRPFYFLTDDNLTYSFPIIATIGFNLGHGKSPFINEFLFGGGYNLLHDVNSLHQWNPVVLLASLFGNTPFADAIIDICASVYALVGALSFAALLIYLRRLHNLSLPNWRIVFLSLSYTFSIFALQTGASWFLFLANQAILPIFFLGLFHQKRTVGVGLVALSIICSLLFAHLSPFLWTLFFISVFVVGWAYADKTHEPLLRWASGVTLGFLVVSPLLFQVVQGFTSSGRNGALSIEEASISALSVPLFLSSIVGGYGCVFIYAVLVTKQLSPVLGFPSFAASWLLFQPPPRDTETKRPTGGIERVLLMVALLVVLLVSRPHWLGSIISHIPLYRSLRWPFREVFLFLFFAHVWIALRPSTRSPRVSAALTAIGSVIFLASLSITPLTFRAMIFDRKLVLSGQAQSYWDRVKSSLGPEDQIIAVAPPQILLTQYKKVPFSLLGAYNYPSLFQVRSASGYAASGLSHQSLGGVKPSHWSGTYSPEDGARLLARSPHLKAIQLVSLKPLRIELRTATSRQNLELPPIAIQWSQSG